VSELWWYMGELKKSISNKSISKGTITSVSDKCVVDTLLHGTISISYASVASLLETLELIPTGIL